MKAKEYFNRYINEYQDKSNEWKVIKTFQDIFCEAEEIAKSRNAKTDNAYKSIFKELNDKANSFIRMVNERDNMQLKNDAFKIFVKNESPEFYKLVFAD